MQFLFGGDFAFSRYPMTKTIVPINVVRFHWPETTTKILNRPKRTYAKILQRQCYKALFVPSALSVFKENYNSH